MRTRWFAIAVVGSLVVVGGCGDKGPPPARPTAGSGSAAGVGSGGSGAGSATPVAEPVVALPEGFPDSAAGHQLAWVIDVIVHRGGAVDEAEVERHFASTFLAQVPPAQTVAVFGQLAQRAGAMKITKVTPVANGAGVVAVAEVDDLR